MKDFILLKRTYPVSRHGRICNGYEYIIKNSTYQERKSWGIDDNELRKIINKDEKYMYIVAKEGNEFRTMDICFDNYAIIKKYIQKLDE